MRILRTVNCGLRIEEGNNAVLIDAIHAGTASCMNEMPEELLEDMQAGTGIFADTKALIFTHMHEDHFDSRIMEKYLSLPHGKRVLIYAPDYNKNTLPLTKLDKYTGVADIGPFRVWFITTLHENKSFQNCTHRSIIVKTESCSIFIAGDAGMQENETQRIINCAGTHFDAVFMNPFQISQENGRRFLECIHAENIFVYHIPDKEIDENYYGMMARTAIRHWPSDKLKPVILSKMNNVYVPK